MRLFTKIAKRILSTKLGSVTREKQVHNLDTAKTAGVLWMVDQQAAFEKIQEKLLKAGIKVTGLCYVPLRKAVLPAAVNGFTKKQTSYWTEIPHAELAEPFIHQKFDILIDLSVQKCFPVVYLAALSEASFKIGYSGKEDNYFDLNIDFAQLPETEKLADQVLYYLTRINKTTIE